MRNSKREHKKNLCIWAIRLVYLDNIGVPMKRTYQKGRSKDREEMENQPNKGLEIDQLN